MAEGDPATAEESGGSRNPLDSLLFGRWLLASLVAGTGVGIQAVTVPLFIRDRVEDEARAAAIAAALIAQSLPAALLVLVGGSLADRVERGRILVRTYSAAALVSIFYVLLAGADVRSIWPVFPLAAAVGCAGAFTNPARQSMVPQLVTRRQIQTGVILGNMSFMATLQFLGPMLGGIVTDLSGLTAAFAIEVILLASAAALFSRVHTEAPTPTGRSVLADLRDGLRYVTRDPRLIGLLAISVVPGIFFMGPFAVTVPLLVPDVLHASDRWVGILWGSFGAGVVLGSLALTFRPIPRRGLAICLSTVVGGCIMPFYGSSETPWVSASLLVLWGLGASAFINHAIALLQEHTDPPMMGRVMSMYSLAFMGASPIGYAQAGALTSTFGPQATLVYNGFAAAVIGLGCALFLRSVRTLD